MRVMGSFWGSRISISQLSLLCHFARYLDEVFVCYPAVFIFGNIRGLLEARAAFSGTLAALARWRQLIS